MKFPFINQIQLRKAISVHEIEINILRVKLANERTELRNLSTFLEETPNEKTPKNER